MTAEDKAAAEKSHFLRGNFDPYSLPDFDTDFISQDDLDEFEKALVAPEAIPVTALNDWRPVHQKVRRSKKRRAAKRRSKDETREGIVYTLLKWPFLAVVLGWIILLSVLYGLIRLYIYSYEHFVTWTGKRERLRRKLRSSTSYESWSTAATDLDKYLGNEKWKEQGEYAYYDHKTVRKVTAQLVNLRARVEKEDTERGNGVGGLRPIDELKSLLENCVKNNFVGVENPRLYSESYLGTKNLVQDFVDETNRSLKAVLESPLITDKDRQTFFKQLDTNYGRTALCLSGGATLAYYHFGVIKALLDTGDLPEIITGTSGGALVAALAATRTNDELKQLLVPALAYRITACADPFSVWIRRWWRTGARFDSLEWARHCSWFCRGSMTFREAYERTGRILNVSCVPSDPHSPTILTNYLTAPDCVVWSAVLASAAVPGILNPIVLMRKTKDGSIVPYSFGHKWKDGSLRTDIPLKSLNLHFNVNFSIVSQVNPHINLFFFSSRGTVGRPVTHRRGRGWRGGFLGSAFETTLKLDMQKYLKILRHLELLPRPLGQDWSEIWLQRFSGTITIWPKSEAGDFWNILSDPSAERLGRMIRKGEQSTWPKVRFVQNRMQVEKIIVEGLRRSQNALGEPVQQEPNTFMKEMQKGEGMIEPDASTTNSNSSLSPPSRSQAMNGGSKPSRQREFQLRRSEQPLRRHSSILQELKRQSTVFFDDSHDDDEDEAESHTDAATTDEEAVTGDEEDVNVMVGKEKG